MRKRVIFLFSGVVVLTAVLAATLVWPWHLLRGDAAPTAERAGMTPGVAVPSAVVAVAARLVGGDIEQQRATLSPELDQMLSPGSLFPTGSSIALDADGWHQSGTRANAVGTLSEPGTASTRVEIGFEEVSGQWLVTFEAKLS